jgi:hypothetical protein
MKRKLRPKVDKYKILLDHLKNPNSIANFKRVIGH